MAQFLLFYEIGGGKSTERMVTSDYQTAIIRLRLKNTGTKALGFLLEDLKEYIVKEFPEQVNVNYSSHYVRMRRVHIIVAGQTRSIVTVLLSVLLLLPIIFRSPQA